MMESTEFCPGCGEVREMDGVLCAPCQADMAGICCRLQAEADLRAQYGTGADEADPVFAVFYMEATSGTIPAVERRDGSFAFPGGKVDPGETPEAALVRECSEEGWVIGPVVLVAAGLVEGRLVAWYAPTGVLARPVSPRPGDSSRPTWADAYWVLRGDLQGPLRAALGI